MAGPRYQDLDLGILAHPGTGDVVFLTDTEAVKRSVKTLILLNLGDLPFRPDVGGNVTRILFETNTRFAIHALRTKVSEVLSNHEPRVKLIDVRTQTTNDGQGLTLDIHFQIRNTKQPLSIQFPLRRLR